MLHVLSDLLFSYIKCASSTHIIPARLGGFLRMKLDASWNPGLQHGAPYLRHTLGKPGRKKRTPENAF